MLSSKLQGTRGNLMLCVERAFVQIFRKSSPRHHKGLRLFVSNNLELIHKEPFCTKDSHKPFLVAVRFVPLKPFFSQLK